MVANESLEATIPASIDAALDWLRERLPAGWEVGESGVSASGPRARGPRAFTVRSPDGTYTTIAVEARRSLSPREVERLLHGLTRLLLDLAGNVPVLVVAPWLSSRTRELLGAEGINFLDLTGNARVVLERPALYIESEGAARNPEPLPRGRARARGPKAARLIRLLADVCPPYGVRDLAAAGELAPGYVSRLLDTFDREALVDRSRRGEVESVDVPGLLRRWAESYDIFKTNHTATYLAQEGASQAFARLLEVEGAGRLAVTGSFAAARLAPVAAPVLLVAYCESPAPIVEALGLLPADEGGNVALLSPFDPVVWELAVGGEERRRYVPASQLAVDCLTGTGRMPAEGEALLAWMAEDETRWRLASLDELGAAGGGE